MKLKNLLLLLILASLWGPSFFFIKLAVVEIPPVTIAALRIGIAAILLNIYLWVTAPSGFKRNSKFWIHVTIAGFFAHALPFVLISWGEIFIDSALAAILNGLTPASTILLAHFLTTDDRLSMSKATGIFLALIGMVLLVSPNLSWEMKSSFQGIVAVIIAAVSYGAGIVYAQIHLKGTPSVYAPASQLLVTSIYMVPLAVMIDGPIDVAAISLSTLGSVGVLAVFGTALAFVLYYRLLESSSASYLSLVTYLVPIYGIGLGMVFLDEVIGYEMLLGAVVILFGVMIANGTINISGQRLKTIPRIFLNSKS